MQTSIGPDANLLAAVGYIVWIAAVLFYFIEDDSEFLKFHSLQAAILGVVLGIVVFVSQIVLGILRLIVAFISDILGTLLSLFFPLIFLLAFAISAFMAFKAFQGERYKLPLLGDFVEGQL